jgi:hypothetical protein
MKKILCALIAGASLMLAGAAHAGVANFDDVATGGDFSQPGRRQPLCRPELECRLVRGRQQHQRLRERRPLRLELRRQRLRRRRSEHQQRHRRSISPAPGSPRPQGGDKASWINISAYDASNQLIGSTGNVAIGASYVWVTANFTTCRCLKITRETGWYVMDDFTTVAPPPARCRCRPRR